jgi:predicted nucleic acid-binding Zn ribbon protein
MYCSACGSPLAAGLSFCNRCGTSLNKDRPPEVEKSLAGILVTAVVLVAIFGLAAAIGGSLALKIAGEFHEAAVVLFMCLSFLVVGTVEILLVRQLSRTLEHGREPKQLHQPTQPLFQPALVPASEARGAHLRSMPEPVTSVTENTTRTLANSFRQS